MLWFPIMPKLHEVGTPPPNVLEVPVAPVCQELQPNQKMIIDRYGAGSPIAFKIPDEEGKLLFPIGKPSVRITVGDGEHFDYIDITDVSDCPWHIKSSGEKGNFVAVRWTERPDRGFGVGSIHRLRPGKMFGIGRQEAIGRKGPFTPPETVAASHAGVGIGEDGKLVIENRNPAGITEVRNLQPTTKEVPPLAARGKRRRPSKHIGNTAAAHVEKPET